MICTAESVVFTPCPPGPEARQTTDLQVLRLDFHIHFLRFGQHGHGAGAGVNAALRFGRRHALHPVHTALILQPLVNIRAGDLENDFFVTRPDRTG